MKPTLLIVDDNEDILSFLEEELSESYSLHLCDNGNAALDLLANESIQLVISDVMMPDMDGFELCRKIKGTMEFSHIPVVMLTAKNTLQSKIEGLELGADAYIEKPFSPAYLQAQIASLLRNRSKIQEFFAHSPLATIKSMGHSKADQSFLDTLTEAIDNNMEDPDFDVDQLARLLNMSRPTLYRKIKELSDLAPSELINLARLKKAAALICEGNHKLYEISYRVGFNSQNNFCRNFLKQFGMTPTQYTAQVQEKRNTLSS